MRVLGLSLLACAAACGGASDSGLFDGTSGGQTTPSDQSASGGTTPPPAPPGATPPPTTPPPSCTTKTTYYEDKDGDGYGGANTQQACSPPDKEWVTQGGDCDDDDPDVFPGQPKYFATAYQLNGLHTFDYDCSKKEEEQPPGYATASTCALSVGTIGSCTGDGYLPVDGRPAGTGVDRICGSTRYQTCTFKQGQGCLASVSDVTAALCH